MSESQKRKERDAEEGSGGSSASKRLKSAEPDFSILCRFDGKEETIQVHSVIMANNSNYFDTLLASGMEETESKTVTLDDVDPDHFRSAIGILEDPESILTVSPEDMMKVAPIYNRFEFKKGLILAEKILGKFLDDFTDGEGMAPVPPELKLIGDVILFSDEANLESLIEKSILFIKEKLDKTKPKCLRLFEKSFIQKIGTFLLGNKEACLSEFLATSYDDEEVVKKYLASPDLLATLGVIVTSKLYESLIWPSEVRYIAKFCIQRRGRRRRGQSILEENAIVAKPFEFGVTTRLPDEKELRCSMALLTRASSRPFASTIYSKFGEIGDWLAKVEVIGGQTYRFVWPCSKSLPLPPLRCQAVYVCEDPNTKGPYPTFELVKYG